ncbi:MAG TPA: carboxypeptidase-like regulatory domain-containing protein [Bryobacteraceae bacterium]|nr:carboxypeptidase-like regulatory domain-containing protein [Bryobacteraceae bacterium]
MRSAISLFLAGATVLSAQTTLGTGAVGGTVRDESSGYIAGVRVVLTEKSKGLTRGSETDSSGSFFFPSVIAGVYRLEAEKVGFESHQVDDLKIEVGEVASVAITLVVGTSHTVVIVSPPSSTELDSDSNTIGSVVDSKRIQELPLNGREFLQLALLAGGALDLSPANNLSTANVGPPSRGVTLPGTFPASTGYSLNGMNINGSRDGELAVGLSVAAIDEFKVQQSFLMPDQASGAGTVNIVTKSGSNQFHGEAFEFLRNRNLDARSFFAATTDDLKRSQFGFALGGPIRRGKLWFHGFYEGTRELTAFSTAGYSPTQAMFEGDFAGSGHTIYDPASYAPDSDDRSPFPSNMIPPNRMNPVARRLLQYYQPGSTLLAQPSNVFGNPRDTLNDNQGGLRVDAALNPGQQLFLQLFTQSTPVDEPGLYPLSGMLYVNGSSLAMVQHTWSLSPQAVNSLRVGFLRAIAVGGNAAQNPVLSSVGISNTFGEDGISTINLQGYSSFGNAIGNVGNRDNTWQIDEELTYTHGGHSLAFGVGTRYRRGWQQNANRQALGALSFQPVFTAQLASSAQGQLTPLANTGDAFADFLLGLPISGTLGGLPTAQYRATQFTPFAQDTWKITPNLTLNYGVSWFVETPPNPQGWARSAIHGFDPSTGLLTFAALGQINPQVISTRWNNLAPRFGVAWKPKAFSSTVLRAGAGIYYSQMPWVFVLFPLYLGSPLGAGMDFTNPQSNSAPVYQLGKNIFPPAPAGPAASTYAANLPPNSSISALDPAFRTAYVTQWNLSIQRNIGANDAMEFSYLGSSGHHLPVVDDISQCRPAPNLFCNAAATPWPRYSLIYHATSSGNSSYEAGIVRYSHRLNRGLNLGFEYTLGKALTDAWESGLTQNAQITDCRHCDKGPATFDVRSRAVASLIWEIPFGRGPVTGGWSITAITTFATGQPILLSGPNQTNTQLLNHLPNRVCDGRNNQLSGNLHNYGFLWFNPACFPVPPVGYFGDSGATVLNGPGLNNWDVGISKSITLTEFVKLQWRAEMFNAWNHTQFQQPDRNSGDGANFGRISATLPPRLIQLAVKVYW